ncbi:hypothetical protein FN976_28640 [Caenimonas sedimenti]|uniref:TnsA endonuclease N-terminal domain-containing protein n=1 Tax=Caenimonas sedimenti TaxID=2596921 RepID=A0A562ZCY2_9BURK|nr:hypothetical protein [Caenimonas sedimenti]TWO62872.1 hypothetical protein FN976_28640 [Caenimonas sedimenti]
MGYELPLREVTRSFRNYFDTSVSWAVREHKYGGLDARYKGGKRRLVRLTDPFSLQPLEFGTPLRADNFLLRCLCPGAVASEVPAGGGLRYFQFGKRWKVPCHLITEFVDGVRTADLVQDASGEVHGGGPDWQQLREVAVAFDVVPCLRRESEIRANPTLLCNLDRVLQHLLCYNRNDLDQQDRVCAVVPSEGRIRVEDVYGELQSSRTPIPAQEVDSALFRLYREGKLQINLAEVSYGPSSTVSQA